MSKELTEPAVGQIWYNKKKKYRFVIISKQTFRNKFYCLRESMLPFTAQWEIFGNSVFLGYTIVDFKDLFRVLQGEPLDDKDTN